MRKFIRIAASTINLFLIAVFALVVYYNIYLPDNFYIAKGNELSISDIIQVTSTDEYCQSTATINKSISNTKTAKLKLAGLIPIKVININEVNQPVLIPCGTPFGIKLLTDGVIVVETSSFETSKGLISPANEAGIKDGDIIVSIQGKNVTSNADVEKIVKQSNGNCLEICLIRNNSNMTVYLKPQQSTSDNCFRAGMWVRDSSAGIGTITFYNPETGVFAGLGHPVCDVDTGGIMPLSSGEVCDVIINGIKKGRQGYPGELMGSFVTGFSVGNLKINCNSGLYGILDNIPSKHEPMPLGMRQDVKLGSATILATINGSEPAEYSIEIEKIDMHNNNSKNMIIRVTDKDLLSQAGGIVQGMSGSPIIQDGKIIGAVTHVFVNNPAKGYAIFADTMYETSQNVPNVYSNSVSCFS